ncbi:ABC transporter [Bifidobacterium minimum]|uniref:ABC transporter n=1 Tax=Bifidobacterium minimum TaxID=1693 RepID=A0A087BNI1_9BIFI|nr:ABC transporter ATP-binding protein [Bifidobacterium minimum]KFI72581.1 ABC transporter [Bifidobacterium minimum]
MSTVIPRGQVVLICGDSGCGKTTVTRLINGLAPHYFEGNLTGTVRVCGLSVADSPLTELSRDVGSVFQNPDSQFLALDVEGELAFGCENYEMDPSEIRRRISAAERDFRLVGLRGRSVRSLSGGQKQTLACAGVACVDPEIMVLDEPSSNLDARAIERLRGIIAMWRARGKTVVIAEHRLYWLNGLVDRVAHMTMGRVDYEMDGEEFFSMEDGRRREWGFAR